MQKAPLLILVVLLAAGAIWWGLSGGPGSGARDDPYGESGEPGGPDPALTGRDPGAAVDPAAERDDPDPAATDPAVEGGLRVVGRVLDPSRRPVAGAQVEALFPGRPVVRGVSDNEGAYELVIGAPPLRWEFGSVRASTPAPLAGATAVTLSPQLIDSTVRAGPITLRAAARLPVRVQQDGAPVEGAEVVVAYEVWGRMTELAAGTTDAAGMFDPGFVPRGLLRVFAARAGAGRTSLGVHVPRTEEGPAVLELLPERELLVRVVDKATKQPVPGARVRVGDRHGNSGVSLLRLLPAYVPEPTDAEGRTVIRTLNDEDDYHVQAEANGYAAPNPMMPGTQARAEPGMTEVTCFLSSYRSISFPIETGDVTPPDDGDTLALQVQSWLKPLMDPGAKAVVENGMLVVTGLPESWTNGRVVADDGSFAIFTARMNTEVGDAVKFQEGLTARVRVVERGSGPIAGARLTWRGGFAFGNQTPVPTDERGEAVLTGMSTGKVTVVMLAPKEGWNGDVLGTIEVTPANAGDVHVLEVTPRSRITLNVTLSGTTGLPPTYTLQVGGRWMGTAELEEDPEAGTIRFDVRLPDDGKRVPVQLNAEGFVSAKGELVSGQSQDLDLRLEASARLTVAVEPPPDGDVSLSLERYDEERDRWVNAIYSLPHGVSGSTSGRREAYEAVFLVNSPGRIRVREFHSDTYSAPVPIVLGGEARTQIDLSNLVWITVQVELPERQRVSRARVIRTDVPPDHRLGEKNGNPVDGRGRSKVRARRSEVVPLSVKHPSCVAAAEGGRARVTAVPGARVTLRLEASHLLTFRLPSAASPGFERASRVMLFTGDLDGEPVLSTTSMVRDGVQEVGGFEPGTYTIWIDPFVGAPIVLKGKTLASGTTDLGLLTPGTGGKIRVTVLHGSGDDPPLAWVVARRLGGISLSRAGSRPAKSNDDIVVKGLAEGRYEVTLRRPAGESSGKTLLPQQVDVGADGETAITFDVRGK